ncbi:hypothetical protein K461DRAFT_315933 [Myriangium duriaei CBS 260.36]|uniref:THIF-type NAD/FAD binding fold domain-containing protein n=1 Tax=Myriangium duriaei CBS 260.36 TaxID=1168546 RepID=A0A9P4IWA3_9PEZI|nr:hypothetical protein K461DRAFT_315933 [Myriangium duriaei CBS 260.36]
MQTNFFARVATSFSWNRHAPPPLIQLSSSSTSSAPSNATSSIESSDSESKDTASRPADSTAFRDWNPALLYSFDAVHDGRSGTNANIFEIGLEVFFYGLESGLALGRFNEVVIVGHCADSSQGRIKGGPARSLRGISAELVFVPKSACEDCPWRSENLMYRGDRADSVSNGKLRLLGYEIEIVSPSRVHGRFKHDRNIVTTISSITKMSAANTDTPPPIQHIPSAKEKKYDRQLRLWAAAGQAALEEAHILLINSGPGVTGIEALKNLILPGIGKFTIQDSAIVSEADLGINFFLDDSSLGKPRAEQTCKYLLELNPDVSGHYITEPATSWISSSPAVLQPYTLIVIACPIAPDVLSQIVQSAQQNGVALFHLHSVGFYSQFSIMLPSAFPIVDTHPDPVSTTDLRLLKPWPALIQFAHEKTHNIKNLAGFELGHIPYVLLLLYLLDEWRSNHNGESPTSYKDKTAFREFVRLSGPPEEENFTEAASAVLKTINPPQVSSSVLTVLQAPEVQNLTSSSASFWFIASAVHAFYQKHQQLPLPGALPDMKAQSSDYIALQNIYKTKARDDCAEVTATVRALEQQHGRSTSIPASEIEQFCKLAAHIKLIRGSARPLTLALDHLSWTPEAGKALVNALPNSEFGLENCVLVYIAFVAYDHFLTSHTDADKFASAPRPPGLTDPESDAEKLTGIAFKILDTAINTAGTEVENPQYDNVKQELANICQELTRAGGAELHNIASLTGGIVAEEIIKVITRQYVPADNTVVFDGVRSMTGVLKV